MFNKSKEPWYETAWDFVYLPVYMFFRWTLWENIKPSNFKHWYQRARYGYSYRDVWSIDWHLANIIPKMIRDMKKDLHGCPGDVETMLQWEMILNKIANGFELQYEIIDHTLFDCPGENEEKTMRELMEDKDTFKGCRIMTSKEKKELNEGWDLFRKHFMSLWD